MIVRCTLDPEALKTLSSTLGLSGHVLTRDPSQLGSQLWGRLVGTSNHWLQCLLEQSRQSSRRWLRPTTRSLAPPGGPLLGRLSANDREFSNGATKAIITNNEKTVVTVGFKDATVWDLVTLSEVVTVTHSEEILGLAVSPDAAKVITASEGTALIWELATGKQLGVLKPGGSTMFYWIKAIAIVPDGTRAITATLGGEVDVWDLATYKCLKTGSTDRVDMVAVTPDGHRMLFNADNSVRIWDIETCKEIATLTGHTEFVRALAVVPDGSRAVSVGADQTLRVWDLNTFKLVATIAIELYGSASAVVMPDCRHAVITSYGSTTAWDLVDARKVATIGYLPEHALIAVTQDGQRALVGTQGGLLLYDLSDSTKWETVSTLKLRAGAVAVSPLSKCAIVSLEDGTSSVWDLSGSQHTATFRGHHGGINGAAISPDGQYAVTASDDQTIRVWNLSDFNEVGTLQGHSGRVNAVAFTPDGSRIVSGGADSTVRVWDFEERRELKVLSGHTAAVATVLVTSDGLRALTAEEDRIFVWDLSTYRELAKLHSYVDLDSISPPYAPIRSISLSAEGHFALVACDDVVVEVINWPDVYSASESKTRIWDLNTYEKIREFSGTAGDITPNGRFALTAIGNSLRLWDIDGSGWKVLSGNAGTITKAVVSPNGMFAVSIADRSLVMWDLKSRMPMASFTADESLDKIVITPDSGTIIGTDNIGGVHFLAVE